jgi:hypothetical protein
VTRSGVTTVLRAENVHGALATADATWLAYLEPGKDYGYRLVLGTIDADGAATARFEIPGGVSDIPGRASISAAGRYVALLWRMPTGSNWNSGRLVVSADSGKSFQVVDTPTGGGIAISPSGSAVIIGGPGYDQIYASTNVLSEAFVEINPAFEESQTFHDPIYVNGRFTALARSRVTIPNTPTVISSRDGHSWDYSGFSEDASQELDLGVFQIASNDGMNVSTLFTSSSCGGFKSGCRDTVEVRYSTDAGKSFHTVAGHTR